MKNLFVLLFICVFTIKTKAQGYNYFNLLGKTEKDIKKSLEKDSGILKFDKFISYDMGIDPPHKQLVFSLPSISNSHGIGNIWFMLTKNDVCYKCVLWYVDDKFKIELINQLEKSGFIKAKDKSEWTKFNTKITINNANSSNSNFKTAFGAIGELIKK